MIRKLAAVTFAAALGAAVAGCQNDGWGGDDRDTSGSGQQNTNMNRDGSMNRGTSGQQGQTQQQRQQGQQDNMNRGGTGGTGTGTGSGGTGTGGTGTGGTGGGTGSSGGSR